jgi:acyl carrier protein
VLGRLFANKLQKIEFRNAEELQDWLVQELARRLKVAPESISVKQPLASLGLDSRTAIALSGDLEKVLGRELSPTLAWDYPTVEALAEHLMNPA